MHVLQLGGRLDSSGPIGPDWVKITTQRRRESLTRSSSPADRLALLRELTRLHDGSLNLRANDIQLTLDERNLLPRFFLSLSANGEWLRIEDDNALDVSVPQLRSALALDSRSRRLFRTASADAALLRLSPHHSYQSPTQKAAVRAMLSMRPGGAMMVSMPTGSGKSLLFQMAPVFWREQIPGACVVVITPTVALAEDHERTLRSFPGLDSSRAITGQVTGTERQTIVDAFRRGEIPILLLSPEAAIGKDIQNALIEAAKSPERKFGLGGRLMALFVDEAHIIEQWGRNFRPDFQRLPALAKALASENPELRSVLLSATLAPAARNELRRAYAGEQWLEIHAESPRYEFDLRVRSFDDAEERARALDLVIDLAPRPAIVYTTRVDDAEHLYDRLKSERGYRRVELFTGETTGAERRRIVNGWARDEFDLVVATSAFGLGIDKPDVRSIVHACLPETAARYYQEIGRASRDGFQGLGVCLWTNAEVKPRSDEGDAFSFAAGGWLRRPLAQARWKALYESADSHAWVTEPGQKPSLQMNVRLNAARDGLGPYVGIKNREWNRALLTLLQRAGALDIDIVGDPDADNPIWRLSLHWMELIGDGGGTESQWDEIFRVRDAEQKHSVGHYNTFRSAMRDGGRRCLLRSIFGQIEPDAWAAPDCGRCSVCIGRGVAPPTMVQTRGTDVAWEIGHVTLSVEFALLDVNQTRVRNSLDEIVLELTRRGIEQFIVPDDCANHTAIQLARTNARYGFVLGVQDWLDSNWALAALPTAIIGAFESAAYGPEILRRCRDFANRLGQRTYIVDDRSLVVSGRRLDQVATLLVYSLNLPGSAAA